MKTKAEREVLSRRRQELRQKLVVWEQKAKDLQFHPELKNELDFAKTELKKCRESMWNLNVVEKRQRTWADGRKRA
jgi:hypothetical protein